MLKKDVLTAKIRKEDEVLARHFSQIKSGDYPYEIRRLLEKAILQEKEEQEILSKRQG